MDAARSELDFQPEIVDRLHLLMDQETAISSDHIVNIIPESSPNNGPEDVRNIPESSSNNSRIPNDEGAIPNPSTSQEMALSASLTGPNQASLRASTVRRLASLGRNSNGNIYGARQRRSPLNSGAWVSVELLAIMSQIVASIVVLSISRDEKPRTPLATWIICYAVGCFGTLPLLYWRYTHRYPRQPIQDLLTPPIISPSGSSRHQAAASSASSSALFQDEEMNARLASFRANQLSRSRDLRLGILMERFKIGLDCFFAVWFVTGNVWVFGGHSSASVAPNIYRLCIVFLAISCIGYAMPFILCATICCCLPCIIALIGHQEDHGQAKGATSEVIRALPTYKFKAKQCTESKGVKEGNDSDGEGSGEGGFVAFGTDKERAVSPDDAACCICLGKYKDGADLRELPCTHFFHTKCVDEWLGINASCPLCKHEITSHNLE